MTTGYHLTFLNRRMERKTLNSKRWVKFAVQKRPNDVRLIVNKSACKSSSSQTSFWSSILWNLSKKNLSVAPLQAFIRCITRSELLGGRLRTFLAILNLKNFSLRVQECRLKELVCSFGRFLSLDATHQTTLAVVRKMTFFFWFLLHECMYATASKTFPCQFLLRNFIFQAILNIMQFTICYAPKAEVTWLGLWASEKRGVAWIFFAIISPCKKID